VLPEGCPVTFLFKLSILLIVIIVFFLAYFPRDFLLFIFVFALRNR